MIKENNPKTYRLVLLIATIAVPLLYLPALLDDDVAAYQLVLFGVLTFICGIGFYKGYKNL